LDSSADKYVSIVSAWEFTVKHSLGKLDLEGGVDGFFQILEENGFTVIGVESVYMYYLAKLPLIHHDPFDRILIATALAEEMRLVTADDNIRKYDVPISW
jgi:PIN domain nuclease of toxin-antitoxin system